MDKYWLQTGSGDLVEVYSGATIEVLGDEGEPQRVMLRSNGVEREVYRGSQARDYVHGLARAFWAASGEELISYGRGKKSA